MAHGALVNVLWQPGREGGLGKNMYMYLYGWVPLLFTWNYYSIVNWLHLSKKWKVFFFFSLNVLITDAEAETPILWPPHAKSWLLGKDPDAGRDWGQEEKGTTEDEMAGWHHWRWAWVWVNSGSWWWTGRPGVLRFMGLQRLRHDWATELNWTECAYLSNCGHFKRYYTWYFSGTTGIFPWGYLLKKNSEKKIIYWLAESTLKMIRVA